jgi:eukaryotic-like serine/threonine-protein kinase
MRNLSASRVRLNFAPPGERGKPAMEQPATKRFGRYEVVGELGRGAMGVVYKARDPQIDRLVAVKTVSLRGQDPEAEKEYRMRFLNEAQAAGRLHHPGIVSVFDVGEDEESGDPYIVLEYVAGEALNRVLARERKLTLARALQIAEEVARALDYAHEQGVTHRDIKPGNIMVTEDGHAKIADFGIAKLNLAHFTLPGRLLGTPAYMAPEQLSGEAVDGRSDLFSLGVILYAMVTGHSPFQGDSATTVCFKVANREPVPASALDLDVPRVLDAVIARAMSKDPEQRYQRGAAFADDLAELRTQKLTGTTSLTNLNARTRTATAIPPLSGPPAVGLAYAGKMIRSRLLEGHAKDIAIALISVVVLLGIGVQSKLLVLSHAGAVTTPAVAAHTDGVANASGAQVQVSAPIKPAVEVAASPVRVAKNAAAHSALATAPAKADILRRGTTAGPLSTVELEIRHQFKQATLTVWLDGRLVLTRPLHGGTQKRLVVFNDVRGAESETIKVPEGKHELRFRAQTDDHTVDLSRTVYGDFAGGEDKTLQISFDKHNSAMRLDWQ